jgi:hypothetical protein
MQQAARPHQHHHLKIFLSSRERDGARLRLADGGAELPREGGGLALAPAAGAGGEGLSLEGRCGCARVCGAALWTPLDGEGDWCVPRRARDEGIGRGLGVVFGAMTSWADAPAPSCCCADACLMRCRPERGVLAREPRNLLKSRRSELSSVLSSCGLQHVLALSPLSPTAPSSSPPARPQVAHAPAGPASKRPAWSMRECC